MIFFLLFQQGFVNGLFSLIILFPILMLSLAFHEFGHAYSAMLYGDNTAKDLGRVTLNPLKHLDLKGTLLLLFLGFGYAKPVPINVMNFTKLREGYFVVSIAGIVCNLITFLLFGIIGYLIDSEFVKALCSITMMINASLAIFNLFPIFPMDGGRILECIWNKGRNVSKWLQRNDLVAYGLMLFSAFYLMPIVNKTVISPIISMFLS